MYRHAESAPSTPANFELGAAEQLSSDNGWVIREKLIPWAEFEEEYAQKFSQEIGAPAKVFKVTLGAPIIKEILGVSDREVVEQIKKNLTIYE